MSSVALTPRPGLFSLAPQSFQEALRFAREMADSGMVPEFYAGKPGRILAAMQYGAEVGLPPMQSLLRIFFVHDKPCMDTRGLLSIVEASGHLLNKVEDWNEGTMTATVTLQRRGRPQSITRTFSLRDAQRVKCKQDKQWTTLDQKDTYQSYPQRMYTRRALGYALHDEFSDVIGGLVAWDTIAELDPSSASGPARNDLGGRITVEAEATLEAPTNGTIDLELATKLEQAFAAIHLPPAMQRLKQAQFRGRESALLDWCRKEYAIRNGIKPKAPLSPADIHVKAESAAAPADSASPEPPASDASTSTPDPDAPELLTLPGGAVVRGDTGEVVAQPASKLTLVGRAKNTTQPAQPALVGEDK